MSLPIRHLPVLQNWDCQGCSNCCREYQISVTEAERQRILSQGWDKEPEFGQLPLFARTGPWWSRRYRLNQRSDEACVFLSEQGRCRIHERFGAEAKPLACRLYPFVLVPAGDHWRVGLRYSCPSAAGNQGRPMTEHKLDAYAAELEKAPWAPSGVETAGGRPPRLQSGQRMDWPDLLRLAQVVLSIVRNRQMRVEQRLRLCLALARLCRQAHFDKVTGGRLSEFLNLTTAGLESEVPPEPAALPPPAWIGRVLFRQVLALYARKDHGPHSGLAGRSRWVLFLAAWRFARGQGLVPRVHGWMPVTTFARVEEPTGPLPLAAEKTLERYYAVKVESLQFCGPTNYGLPFWQGLESLALTLPVILWLTRAMSGVTHGVPPEEAVSRAIAMVDHNFGFNRLLGTFRQRLSLNILVQRGELDRLIAWYSR